MLPLKFLKVSSSFLIMKNLGIGTIKSVPKYFKEHQKTKIMHGKGM
jgi:hypothetical protein